MSAISPSRRSLVGLSLGLLAAALAAGGARAGDAKQDLDKLQGTWRMTGFAVEGKNDPKHAEGNSLVIAGNKLITVSVKAGKENRQKGSFKIDPSKSPKQIDVIADEGPEKGKAVPGIYELQGNTLRIAINPAARPANFTPAQGSRTLVLTFQRAKK